MPETLDLASILPVLIVTLTPFVVEVVKRLSAMAVGKMPKWLTPIIASALGAAVDVFIGGGNGLTGAIAGGASTAARDVAVNVKASATAKLIPIFLVSVLMAGCTGATGLSARGEMAVSCRAFSGVLDILTPIKPRMKPTQVATVDAAETIMTPLCRAALKGGAETTRAQLQAVRDAIRKAMDVEKEIKN